MKKNKFKEGDIVHHKLVKNDFIVLEVSRSPLGCMYKCRFATKTSEGFLVDDFEEFELEK